MSQEDISLTLKPWEIEAATDALYWAMGKCRFDPATYQDYYETRKKLLGFLVER